MTLGLHVRHDITYYLHFYDKLYETTINARIYSIETMLFA